MPRHLPVRVGLARRRLTAAAAVLAASAVAAGCGSSGHPGAGRTSASSSAATTSSSSSSSGGRSALRVTPADPGARDAITFTFTAPADAHVTRGETAAYSLRLMAAGQGHCVVADEQGLPGTAGASGSVTLGPAQLHLPWCPGAYLARVDELARPRCSRRGPCAQYVRLVGVVARVRFTVAAR